MRNVFVGIIAAALASGEPPDPPVGAANVCRFDNIGGHGDRTAIITPSSNMVFGNGGADRTIDMSGTNWRLNGGQAGYIRWDFGVGKSKKIIAIGWAKDRTDDMGTWTLQASNDGSTWVNITNAFTTTGMSVLVASNGANDGFYRYYQIVTAASVSSSLNGPVTFCILDGAGADNKAAISPDYSTFLGSGNRQTYILVGGTTAFSGNKQFIVNGAYTNQVWFTAGQSGTYIEFDFFCDVLITEFTWFQANTTAHGTWKWQHYDEELAAWVDVGATFTLGGVTDTIVAVMSGATTYHRKYRLQQVSGTTSSSGYNREIDFKLGFPEIA